MEKVWQYSLADGWSEIENPAPGGGDWHGNLKAAGYGLLLGVEGSYVPHVVVWGAQFGNSAIPQYLVYLDDDACFFGNVFCKDEPSFMEILGKYSAIAANLAAVGKREDEVDRQADRAVTKEADDKRRGR